MEIIAQANDYAIRSLVYLINHKNHKPVTTKVISKKLKIPYPFLSKIFQKLIKKNILKSYKGYNGGIELTKYGKNVSLKEIFQSIDEIPVLRKCILDKKICFLSRKCSANKLLTEIQLYIEKKFQKLTLHRLANS